MENIIEQLLGPSEKFLNEYWGHTPYLHQASEHSELREILTLARMDELFSQPASRPPYVEVKRQGNGVRESIWTCRRGSPALIIPDSPNVRMLAAEFAKGATLILNSIDDFDPPNRIIRDALHVLLQAPVKTVAFITPPNTQGLGSHYDAFEGFILQTHGTKTWTVYDQVDPLPNRSMGYHEGRVPTSATLEVTLHPGDCLYVPWGAPHHATTTDQISCHVTFMAYPRQWRDYVQFLLIRLAPEYFADTIPMLGELCPPESRTLDKSLREIESRFTNADLEQYFAEFLHGENQPTPPTSNGFISATSRAVKLGIESKVTRNTAISVSVTANDDTSVTVRIGRLVAKMSSAALPTLIALQDVSSTPLDQCRHGLSEDALLDIARLFISHAALTIELERGM